MRWVKVHVTLRHHRLLRRCSVTARYLFRVCLEILGDYEQGDALALRGPQGPIPMTVAEIAEEAGLKGREGVSALRELVSIGLIGERDPETYFVPRFIEKTASTSTERVRRFRDKQKRVTETQGNANETLVTKRVEVEREEDIDTSLRSVGARATGETGLTETTTPVKAAAESPALQFARWFAQEGLRRLAIPPHVVMDEFAWAYKQVTPAEQLLESYSLDECQRRAIRLMEAVRNKKIRRGCNIQSLADCWDWSMIDTERPIVRETSSPQSPGPVQNAAPYKELPPAPAQPALTDEQREENLRRVRELTQRLTGTAS